MPLSVCVGLRYGNERAPRPVLLQYLVPELYGETVLEVEYTRLADVLHLSAGLAYYRGFEPSLTPGLPAEDCERLLADLACVTVRLLGHSHVGVVTETGLTDYGRLGGLPGLLTTVGLALHSALCHFRGDWGGEAR